MTKEKKLYKQLTTILNNENECIRKYVAQEALDYYFIETFFHDILQYGCKNGAVSSLIYYTQTHEFFDKFYNDIEAIRHEYEYNQAMHIDLSNDLKNTLTWFAFEETTYQIANELKLLE